MTAVSPTIASVSPVTGEIVASALIQETEGVAAAVSAASLMAREWAAKTPTERARHLLRIRESFADRGDAIAESTSAETGKPLADAWAEVLTACSMWGWAARQGPRLLSSRRIGAGPLVVKRARVHYEPYGVVGVIAPSNYPVVVPMQSIPSALAAGNTVVFKPSQRTLRTGQLIAEAINSAGIELVHVITGDGQTGEALARSAVQKLVFTGSPGVGRAVVGAAAWSLTPVVLQVGGKASAIVCRDADLGRAVRTVVGAAFTNAGQLGAATERVYVVSAVYDEFVERVVELTRQLRVGPQPDADFGPLARPEQAVVLESRLLDAECAGARILVGGRRRDDFPAVYFEPTVVVDVNPDMVLMQHASPGPVLTIMRVETPEDAAALVNMAAYAQNASVFTRDERHGRRVAAKLSVDWVHINDALVGHTVSGEPLVGLRASGSGRYDVRTGVLEFSRTKTVLSDRGRWMSYVAGMLMTERLRGPAALSRIASMRYSSERLTKRLQTRRARA
ncbi:MAG: hypothetical protein QOJ29_2591 [Thermoleophilaceae bacterium]|nr:hypothetical protein [Thermoleophilaceae bacterium]